jgi:hypothetical protein
MFSGLFPQNYRPLAAWATAPPSLATLGAMRETMPA